MGNRAGENKPGKNRPEKEHTENSRIWRIFLCIFLLGAAVSAGILIRNAIVKQNAEKTYEQLAASVTEDAGERETLTTEEAEAAETGEESIIPEKNPEWETLAEENPDIYAWLYVPGTGIDYPVLQHEEDDEYYLTHNLDGSSGYPGCIFTQSLNSREFTDFNTVLYGHNMKDGSMFAGLHEFEDNEFFEENSYIYIYTPETDYAYEIFAAYEFSDAHLLYSYDLTTEAGRESYLEEVMNSREMNTHYRQGVSVDADSRIITLSTCVSGQSDKRYLVQGVLVEKSETAE